MCETLCAILYHNFVHICVQNRTECHAFLKWAAPCAAYLPGKCGARSPCEWKGRQARNTPVCILAYPPGARTYTSLAQALQLLA